ncbi:hypothetical protein ONZ51_g2012 [Trametes cubensis]|uniref:Uncharacterized protein n=1 Tax=Trametes cubensis TaxID=1111947 RepID=A0AAD7U0W8_9APHY|nr:hypothetical protein ONZ51_g2012 [Trametes cubensis]
MPASEIDEIFASKGKAPSAAKPAASSSSTQPPDKKKKKKKDKSAKRKRDDADADPEPEAAAPPKPVKRKVPETVFDPSAAIPSAKESKPRKGDKSAVSAAAKPKTPKLDREEEQRFKDSRGTGPRRKTEEGFAIYKEDELGITDQGGGQWPIPHCVPLIVNVVSEMYQYHPLAVSIDDTPILLASIMREIHDGSIEASPTASAMVERGQCVAKSEL